MEGTCFLSDLVWDAVTPWKDVTSVNAPNAPAPATVTAVSQTLGSSAQIEEAVAELAALVTQIERRLARTPVPETSSPATRYIRRAPSLPKRFD